MRLDLGVPYKRTFNFAKNFSWRGRERKGKREVVNLQEMTTEILPSENVLSYFYDH